MFGVSVSSALEEEAEDHSTNLTTFPLLKLILCYSPKHMFQQPPTLTFYPLLLSPQSFYIVFIHQLEKAVTYEERRLIRGQLRIAKRVGSSTTPARTPAPSKTRAPDKTPTPAKAPTSDVPADKTERKRSTAELIMKQPKEEETPRRVSKGEYS